MTGICEPQGNPGLDTCEEVAAPAAFRQLHVSKCVLRFLLDVHTWAFHTRTNYQRPGPSLNQPQGLSLQILATHFPKGGQDQDRCRPAADSGWDHDHHNAALEHSALRGVRTPPLSLLRLRSATWISTVLSNPSVNKRSPCPPRVYILGVGVGGPPNR